MAWTLIDAGEILGISSQKTKSIILDASEIACVEVSFSSSGEAVFYSNGTKDDSGAKIDTSGYLNTYAADIDVDNGVPLKYVTYNDDGDEDGDGWNFRLKYNVEAGKSYYLYVRHNQETRSGEVPLVIVPPEEEELYIPDDYGSLEASVSGTDVVLELTGLDANYDNRRKAVWSVYYKDDAGSNVYVLKETEIYSDGYDTEWTYKKITLSAEDGIQPNTKHYAMVWVYCYPDTGDQQISGIIAGTFTAGSAPSPDRPAKFAWTYTKTKGGTFNLTAAEWEGLLDNIKAVLEYKGLTVPSTGTGVAQFYYPSKGEEFEAYMYNQVMYQLLRLGVSDYASVSSDDPVTADALNLLVEKINSVS